MFKLRVKSISKEKGCWDVLGEKEEESVLGRGNKGVEVRWEKEEEYSKCRIVGEVIGWRVGIR